MPTNDETMQAARAALHKSPADAALDVVVERVGAAVLAKHTPGPWQAWNTHGSHIMKNWRVGSRGVTPGIVTPVCTLDGAGVVDSSDEEVANARLIAAAPALLAVCQEIAEHGTDDWDARMRTLRAAIALAEGGAK